MKAEAKALLEEMDLRGEIYGKLREQERRLNWYKDFVHWLFERYSIKRKESND